MVENKDKHPYKFGELFVINENKEIVFDQYGMLGKSNVVKFHTFQDSYGVLLSDVNYMLFIF